MHETWLTMNLLGELAPGIWPLWPGDARRAAAGVTAARPGTGQTR